MDIITTTTTYKTRETAIKALDKKLQLSGRTLATTRYIIASTLDGRFAPVLIGADYIPFAFAGVTVVG